MNPRGRLISFTPEQMGPPAAPRHDTVVWFLGRVTGLLPYQAIDKVPPATYTAAQDFSEILQEPFSTAFLSRYFLRAVSCKIFRESGGAT